MTSDSRVIADPTSSIERHIHKEHLVPIALVTTFLSLIPTAYVAFISNSTTLFADFLRCLGEFTAIAASAGVLWKMSRDETSQFNYGYGKLEQLAGIAVAAALFLSFLVSLITGIRGLLFPVRIENAEYGFAFALLSVIGNAFLWGSNYVADRREASPISESQWRLFRAKTCATLVVAVALSLAIYFPETPLSSYADPLGSVALSIFMFWQAYRLVSASIPDLIDYAIEETLQNALSNILSEHQQLYSKVERVRSRRTPRKVYIEILLSFPPEVAFGQVHASSMLIKRAVSERFQGADITVIPSLPRSIPS